jgi:hypothetical protein
MKLESLTIVVTPTGIQRVPDRFDEQPEFVARQAFVAHDVSPKGAMWREFL